MKTTKKIFNGTLAVIIGVSMITTTITAQPKPWNVPANFKSMANPVAKGDASTKAGMTLWTKNCASCHGKMGMGDGVKARMLTTSPGNFSAAAFQNQTDGEIFFKTKTGRDEMPKYEGKLTDDDIWNIVNFTRTLKK